MRERSIERRIIGSLRELGFESARVVRRCSVGRGFGIIDLVLLPERGRYKLVLIEAKRSLAPDAAGKVVGQLLLYHAGLSRLGSAGLRLIQDYCDRNGSRARGVGRKSLQALAGGVRPASAAWNRLRRGKRLDPRQIGLFVALECEASPGLKQMLKALARGYGLRIGVISAYSRGNVKVWRPA
jgi:hypothetical protein